MLSKLIFDIIFGLLVAFYFNIFIWCSMIYLISSSNICARSLGFSAYKRFCLSLSHTQMHTHILFLYLYPFLSSSLPVSFFPFIFFLFFSPCIGQNCQYNVAQNCQGQQFFSFPHSQTVGKFLVTNLYDINYRSFKNEHNQVEKFSFYFQFKCCYGKNRPCQMLSLSLLERSCVFVILFLMVNQLCIPGRNYSQL